MNLRLALLGTVALMAAAPLWAADSDRVFFGIIRADRSQRAWILPDGTWSYGPKDLPQKEIDRMAAASLRDVRARRPWFADEKRLLEKLAAVDEAAGQPVDPVVLMPLLDAQGKTSLLGTMISLMAMFQATFTPAKRLNLTFPVIAGEMAYGQLVDGQVRPEQYAHDMLLRCVTPHRADGVLTSTEKEHRVELTFSGPKGEKKVARAVPRAEAARLPGLIALEIHAYLGTSLTEAERAHVLAPDLPDEAALRAMGQSMNDQHGDALIALHHQHPKSAFAFTRAMIVAIETRRSDAGHLVANMRKRVGAHPLVQLYEVRGALAVEDRDAGMTLALEMLARDRRNVWLLEMIHALGETARWSTRHVFDRWVRYDPDSFVAHRERGNFYVTWALRTRGSDYVVDLEPACIAAMKERLAPAEAAFERAFELNPRSVRSVLAMMDVIERLGRPREVMEKWFERGQKIGQESYRLHKAKLDYMIRFAKHDEALAFARACAAQKPDDSPVRSILLDFHIHHAFHENEWDYAPYLTKPAVRKELEALFRSMLAANPDSFEALHGMAALSFYSGQFAEAAPYFAKLPDHMAHGVWRYREVYQQAKKIALAMADPVKAGAFFAEQAARMQARSFKKREVPAAKSRPLRGPRVRWLGPDPEPPDRTNWTSRTSFAMSYFGPLVGSRDVTPARLLELPPGGPYTRLFFHVRGWGALPAKDDVQLQAEVALGDRGAWTKLPPVRLAPGFKNRHLLASAKPFDRVRLSLTGRRTQVALWDLVAMRAQRPAGEWIEADRFGTVTAVDATTVTLKGDDGRTAIVPASYVSPKPSGILIAIVHPERPAGIQATGDNWVSMGEARDERYEGEQAWKGILVKGPNPRPYNNDIFLEGAELEAWHDGLGSWLMLARQPAWNVIAYGTVQPSRGVTLGLLVRDDGAVEVTRVQPGISEQDYGSAIQARDLKHLRRLLDQTEGPYPKELISDPKLKMRPGVTLQLQEMAPGVNPPETARLLQAFITDPANELATAHKLRPIEPGDRVAIAWSHRENTFHGTYFKKLEIPELKVMSQSATDTLARTVTQDGSPGVEVSLPASLTPRSPKPFAKDATLLSINRVVPGTGP